MVRRTPKRGAGSSNLPEDANVFRCKPPCWFAAFFVFPGALQRRGQIFYALYGSLYKTKFSVLPGAAADSIEVYLHCPPCVLQSSCQLTFSAQHLTMPRLRRRGRNATIKPQQSRGAGTERQEQNHGTYKERDRCAHCRSAQSQRAHTGTAGRTAGRFSSGRQQMGNKCFPQIKIPLARAEPSYPEYENRQLPVLGGCRFCCVSVHFTVY